MANLNKVYLIGRLTRDPELRYTPGGAAVTDLGLAINRSVTTREGERREETVFVDVTVWSRQAETCCQYLKKGRPVHIEGFLRMDTWEDRNTGEKRSKLKVEADRVQFLDRRDDGSGPGDDEDSAPAPARGESGRRGAPSGGGSNGPAHPPASQSPSQPRKPARPEADEAEDDIPF